VKGEVVLSVVAGMGRYAAQAIEILAGCGIVDLKVGQWYSQDALLRALEQIARTIGSRTLFIIGTTIPEQASFPPDIDSIEKALAAIDVAYHMNHRNGAIGSYSFKTVSERNGVMVCRNPYHCRFDQGLIEATAKRFKPADSAMVFVQHDKEAPCRQTGADSCTYRISW